MLDKTLPAYEIRQDIIRCHGLSVERMVPLPGGWLNRMWKLTTNG